MKASFTLIFSVCFWAATATAQDTIKPLFPGAEYLESCVADLPPSYSEKDTVRYATAALGLNDVELIYLTSGKKDGQATYVRMYVGVFKGGDELTIFYETAREYAKRNAASKALIPTFNPQVRFYLAKCFDEQLVAHPELKRVLKEKRE